MIANPSERLTGYTPSAIAKITEYQQLKRFIMQVVAISLCKLRHFHCASCGIFIVQVVAFSLCKLRIFHKKWCSIPQNETPLI